MENRKACKECIKAHNLPIELLGENKDKCNFCCATIFDFERQRREVDKWRMKVLSALK